MSAIARISNIVISNLELAKQVAKKNNYDYSVGGVIRGYGQRDVDHRFTNTTSSKDFGLVKTEKNNVYDILCDSDWQKTINREFVAGYSKEIIEREAQLSGHGTSVVDNEDEIVLTVEYED